MISIINRVVLRVAYTV